MSTIFVRAFLALCLLFPLSLLPSRASAADCLEFEFFFREPGPFPNPFNPITQGSISSDVALLVIDDNLNIHPASLSVRVFNMRDPFRPQTVMDKSLGTFVTSRRIRLDNIWDGRNNSGNIVASSVYLVELTAKSNLCGKETTTFRVTILK